MGLSRLCGRIGRRQFPVAVLVSVGLHANLSVNNEKVWFDVVLKGD